MRFGYFILIVCAVYFFCECDSRAGLAYQAKRGDTAAMVELGKREYYGCGSNDSYYRKKVDPFKAFRYYEKANSLHSIQADSALRILKNDSMIWLNDEYPIIWYFKQHVLIVDDVSEIFTSSRSWKLAGPIADSVHTLILHNEFQETDWISPYGEDLDEHCLVSVNYSMFKNLDTLVWAGDNATNISTVPKKILNLPSLKVLYLCDLEIDSAISKSFYSCNPKLKIEMLKRPAENQTQKRFEKLIDSY